MNENDGAKCPMEEKTLMENLSTFNNKEESLQALVTLSDSVLQKLINPRPEPIETKMNKECIPIRSSPTLMELFNDSSDNMQLLINCIEKNLEKIRSVIG